MEAKSDIEASDIRNLTAEAGVIATLAGHPEYVWYSEELTPHHFSSKANGYLYYAIETLVKKKHVTKIDAYNITTIFNEREDTKHCAEEVPARAIEEFLDDAPAISGSSPDEYVMLCDQVLEYAFRRDAFRKLRECERMCSEAGESDAVKSKIYQEIENLVYAYQKMDDVVPLGERVDEIWSKIKEGQRNDSFVDFPFPSLNKYVKLSRTDCIIVAAREKRGKSMFLLNCTIDLLRKGKRVLVIDTELDTPLYLMRLLSNLTGIEFSRIRDGAISSDEQEEIEGKLAWIKKQNFCHIYHPVLDDGELVSIVKQYYHRYGVDCVVLDYLKGNSAYFLDAYQNSAILGKVTDTLKNLIAGEMNLIVLSAVQATSTGSIADSQKIIRNCSAMLYLERKSAQQIEADGGPEFGNMTLNVRANRNGAIMADDDYISLTLDGNRCRFFESKQPVHEAPY